MTGTVKNGFSVSTGRKVLINPRSCKRGDSIFPFNARKVFLIEI